MVFLTVSHQPHSTSMANKHLFKLITGFLIFSAIVLSVHLFHTKNTPMLRPPQYDGQTWTQRSTIENDEPCQPQNNVVFLKTHKTASSTAASIFNRYAFSNNLTMAVPRDGHFTMSLTELFRPDMMAPLTDKGRTVLQDVGFNFFTDHARYNRPEMDKVVHNAKYVTIIREPAKQFISAFAYFRFDERMEKVLKRRGQSYHNSLVEFMRNPDENLLLFKSAVHVVALYNAQIFDLGFDIKNSHDTNAINAHIDRLDKDFDLVMITEYMDHSLILLRDLMCWTNDDILYVSRKTNTRTTPDKTFPKWQEKIREWNAADVLLYQHFNQTLWRRIAEYGPTFDYELQKFRKQLKLKLSRRRSSVAIDGHQDIVARMRKNGLYAGQN